jgi:uncharacterized membrane protein YqjE
MQRNLFEVQEVKSATLEVTRAITDILKSEMQLAKTELKEATDNVGHHVVRLGVFAFIGVLGALPLMAFLVIGLGQLLGGDYLLSSLIVSCVFFVVGGGVAYNAYTVIRGSENSLTLPETRNSIAEGFAVETAAIADKIRPIRNVARDLENRRQA